jgi:hypothetical protein
VKRRVLSVLLLLSGAVLVVVAVLYGGFRDAGGTGERAAAPGAFGQDPEAQSRDLDRQLQSTDAHHELLDRLSADLIAGRCTLPEAATLLADFSRERKPDWLRRVGRLHPGRPEQASVAAGLVYYTLFRLQEGDPADEETARRLAADYQARYGIPFTLPADKGAPIPPGWRAASAGRAGGS